MRSIVKWGLVSVISLSAAVGVVACDPFKGTLVVSKSFQVKAGKTRDCPDYEYPCQNQEKTVNVPAGTYAMDIQMANRREALIQLKVNGQKHDVYLNVPKGRNLPDNGHFTLNSRESGQPFDLEADVATTIADSSKTRDREACEIHYQENVCGIVPGNPPRHECRWESRIRWGLRTVEYFYRTTNQAISVDLLSAGSNSRSGEFSGRRQFKDKIYTYQGPCY